MAGGYLIPSEVTEMVEVITVRIPIEDEDGNVKSITQHVLTGTPPMLLEWIADQADISEEQYYPPQNAYYINDRQWEAAICHGAVMRDN
jgi:hypothetical protein